MGDKPLKLTVSIFKIPFPREMDWLLLTHNLFASLESSIIPVEWLQGVIKTINSLTLMVICNKNLIGTFKVLKIYIF